MKTFKKYSNRKLYSSDKKGYVRLEDILNLVKQGETIQVLSHGDGKDVTTEVVREAILRSSEIPTETLVNMVRTKEPVQMSLDI